jgi:hypothetical protein
MTVVQDRGVEQVVNGPQQYTVPLFIRAQLACRSTISTTLSCGAGAGSALGCTGLLQLATEDAAMVARNGR